MGCQITAFTEQNCNNNDNLIPVEIISQLNVVANCLPGFTYLKNRYGVYLWHNNIKDEIRQKYGFPANAIGKTDYDIFPLDIANEYCRKDLETIFSDHSTVMEETCCASTGEPYIQLSYRNTIKDEQGAIIGVVGNLLDITYLKSKEVEMQSTNKKQLMPKYVKELLKEILLLINLISVNEDSDSNLVLIYEIKNFIKTIGN
ncbi:MAG: PAS domain-containing protein [Gammaproteobacteria bacterium]|jgi:hypothetical protein